MVEQLKKEIIEKLDEITDLELLYFVHQLLEQE
jgi:hypothetical protein